MTRAKRLEPVQEAVQEAEQQLAKSLAALERRVADAQAKLQELERYRHEYEQQFTQRAGFGMAVAALRDYQAFLARLADAVRQQQGVVQRASSERDAQRLHWQEAARRAKALAHVMDQWQMEERRARERREQHESDERAQRARSKEAAR